MCIIATVLSGAFGHSTFAFKADAKERGILCALQQQATILEAWGQL